MTMARLACAVLAVHLWFGLTLSAQQPNRGPLSASFEREASRLADTLAVAPFPQQARQPGWAGHHPVLLGALVGAGIGVGWATIKCDLAHKNVDFPCKSILGLQGAVFGGAVGFIVGRR